MTGLEIALRSKTIVQIGPVDCYDWATRTIFLRESVARGSSPFHLLVSAHEAAHHIQNLKWPWMRLLICFDPVWPLKWLKWFWPPLWIIEVQAWTMALELLTA